MTSQYVLLIWIEMILSKKNKKVHDCRIISVEIHFSCRWVEEKLRYFESFDQMLVHLEFICVIDIISNYLRNYRKRVNFSKRFSLDYVGLAFVI